MLEQKRSITQLWDFSSIVVENSQQKNSTATLDTQALKKRVSVDQFKLSSFDSTSFQKNEISTSTFENKSIEQSIDVALQEHYDEFMTLDQVEHAMIDSNNNKNSNLIAIKRIEKVDKSLVNSIASFINDHLVQIKDMYENDNDIVIIYETMNVILRQLIDILQDSLKIFQIATICKEVSQI